MISKAQKLLKDIFGYDDFLPLQKEVISHTLSGKDALVIMPTGGGKSLCYQLPALIHEGMTIVVSPLISLMKDQVEQLQEVGVQALCLNSSLPRDVYRENTGMIKSGKAKLLYVAPETLLMPATLALLESVKIDCLTIDEAHCISEWGHDFRPEYRQIAQVRNHFPKAVCIALTATATPRVQQDIRTNLNFKDSDEFIASFNRTNLFLEIIPKTDPYHQIIKFLTNFPDQSGIIYCMTRKQVDALAMDLDTVGYSVKPYHAGLTDVERNRHQELFIKDDISIIVATIAFGMGINKPNVRFVIHHDLPKNIESYYQQIGRAGRDGLKAHCLLLFSYGDLQRLNYFIQKMNITEQQVARMHLDRLVDLAETEQCRRIPLLSYFGEASTTENCGICDNCTREKQDMVDITIPAQMLLSCIVRTGQLFGMVHVIDILRGSKAKKVMNLRHDQLSVYGIGMEFSKKQWGHFTRQMITKGVITKDPDHGSLKVTDSGHQILRGQKTTQGTLLDEVTATVTANLTDRAYNKDLFDILRSKRKQLADLADVPPYIIFSDRSLIDMASQYPENELDFLHVHGVGRKKMKKYGSEFIYLINNFCQNNSINRKALRSGTLRPSLRKKRFIEVSEKYNKGQTIQALMREYRVKQSTILGHLNNYLQSGGDIRADEVLMLSGISEQEQKDVFSIFDDIGCVQLRPVFEKLNETVSFDELRLQRLCYLVQAVVVE